MNQKKAKKMRREVQRAATQEWGRIQADWDTVVYTMKDLPPLKRTEVAYEILLGSKPGILGAILGFVYGLGTAAIVLSIMGVLML